MKNTFPARRMSGRTRALAVTAAVGTLVGTAFMASAAPASAASGGSSVVQTPPAWTASAAKVGAPAADQQLHLSIILNLKDLAGAEALADSVADPSSASYGKFVSSADWRAKFAPSDQDVAAVTAWLKSQGFTVTATPANHRFISFSGSTAQVNAAFGANVATFNKSGSFALAPTAAITVPSSIASVVAGVSGLDTSVRLQPTHTTGADSGTGSTTMMKANAQAKTPAAAAPAPTTTLPAPPAVFKNSGPCSSFYGQSMATGLPQLVKNPQPYAVCGYNPTQLRDAYGVDSALSSGYDGRGATVAVVDAFASPTILADATTYAQRNDSRHPLRSYQFNQSLPANYSYVDECGASGWYGEETLDVEAVHAMAPAANILYVGASSCQDADLMAGVNSVLDNDLAQVITNSYGSAGEPASMADAMAWHEVALQAAAQGVSLLFSSGDAGDEVAATGKRQVDSPASDPYVTAVGGTSLAVTKSNGYGWEQGWGSGKSTLKNGQWTPIPPAYVYGGGGGTSQLFKQPAYQKKVVPASISNYFGKGAYRAVPDVSMEGDPQTGMLVGQTQTFPDGSQKYSEYRIGGTSLSSPLLAGVVAVGNQVYGQSLGFLNPKLYALAGTPVFHDVNNGNKVTDAVVRVDYVNGVDASGGLNTTLRTINQTGTIYTRAGYDDVTGVGSPNAAVLYGLLASARNHGTSQGGNSQGNQNPGGIGHGGGAMNTQGPGPQ